MLTTVQNIKQQNTSTSQLLNSPPTANTPKKISTVVSTSPVFGLGHGTQILRAKWQYGSRFTTGQLSLPMHSSTGPWWAQSATS
jgi:hypothetical protein